jgi:hypothetical protein
VAARALRVAHDDMLQVSTLVAAVQRAGYVNVSVLV